MTFRPTLSRAAAVLAAPSLFLSLAPAIAGQSAGGSPARPQHAEDELLAWTVQPLEFFEEPDGSRAFMTVVDLGGELRVLDLEPHSMRSPDFRLELVGAEGQRETIVPPAPATFRGVVEGDPGSRVAATRRGKRLTAVVRLGDGTTFGIQPWEDELARAGDHLVHAADHLALTGDTACGGSAAAPADAPEPGDGPGPQHQPHGTPGEPAAGAEGLGAGLQITDIALEADYAYYELNGRSVAATVADVEGVLNSVDEVYRDSVDVGWRLDSIVVRVARGADPYSSDHPNTLISQFRSYWNSQRAEHRTDHNHLFTGRDLTSNVIGIAWCIGCICSPSNSYALSQARFTPIYLGRVALVAHEIGHVYGASHCCGSCSGCGGCRIMCPCIGGCEAGEVSFGNAAANQIVSHRDSRTCLDQGAQAGLTLGPPTPAVTGEWSEVTVAGANPGETVEIFWSKRLGNTPLPDCGTPLGLAVPGSLGRTTAGPDGRARVSVFVPPRAAGMALHFQAAALDSCRLSPTRLFSFSQ